MYDIIQEVQGDITQERKDDLLNYALINGDTDIVAYLLNNGACLNINSVAWAVYHGHTGTIKYLVENGLDVNIQDGLMLKKAAVVGHMELVRYLVEAGADIHTEEDYALRYAAKNGHLEVVRFLIENGADVHAENEFALKTAFFKGFKDIVFYLIDRGADIHIEGEVLLRWAAAEGDKNMVRYLIERGANRKEAALQEAVYYNRIETVELLLELGADAKKIDFTETIDFRILSILWRSFSDEEMLPFLVSGNEGLRKAAKKYLERREDGSL